MQVEALISVIVPIYNKEQSLSTCVQSILNQSYNNIEIILVDDGSKDNSLIVCKKFEGLDQRIKVIHKENGGVSSARNIGLQYAKGDFITFVDADDWIEKNMIEELLQAITRYDADIAGSYFIHDSAEDVQKTTIDSIFKTTTVIHKNEVCSEIAKIYDRKIGWENCSKLFSKRSLNGVSYDEAITNGEDWLFFCKCVVNIEKMVYIPKFYYHYVYNQCSASNSFSLSHISACKASEAVLELDLPFSKQDVLNIKDSIAQNAALCLMSWSKKGINNTKAYAEAKKYVRKYKYGVYLNRKLKIKRKIKFFLYSNFYFLFKLGVKK